MKRVISIFLSLLMVVCVFASLGVTASAKTEIKNELQEQRDAKKKAEEEGASKSENSNQ